MWTVIGITLWTALWLGVFFAVALGISFLLNHFGSDPNAPHPVHRAFQLLGFTKAHKRDLGANNRLASCLLVIALITTVVLVRNPGSSAASFWWDQTCQSVKAGIQNQEVRDIWGNIKYLWDGTDPKTVPPPAVTCTPTATEGWFWGRAAVVLWIIALVASVLAWRDEIGALFNRGKKETNQKKKPAGGDGLTWEVLKETIAKWIVDNANK